MMLTAETLPIIFVALMGLAILIYAILDGYDLGVGMLLPLGEHQQQHRDTMIASIGPFWDANETWLVLAIGLLLIAFPSAHSYILKEFYIPVTIMLIGLIMRGVAFDLRAKVAVDLRHLWDKCFKFGSLLTALTQGYMLGRYIVAFEQSWQAHAFSILSAFGVSAAYVYIGATWLVMKTNSTLQLKAIRWARIAGIVSFIGILLVSSVNPIVNPGVFDRWFTYPLVMFVLLIPITCFSLFIINHLLLTKLPRPNDNYCWLPFVCCMGIFIFSFVGIGFSFFPYIVPGKITVWEAASASESLAFLLYGAVIVIPSILFYTAYSYWVFYGKADKLAYH